MSSVAEQLRQGREDNHLTIDNVAQITKIRGDHVRALEDGNYGVFSAPVYIRGFVRTYASLLRLDVGRVMASLDDELRQTPEFAEPPPLLSPSDGFLDKVMLQFSKLNWFRGAVAIGVVLLLVVVMFARFFWQRYRSIDPLAGLPPGIYHTPATELGETLPLPPAQPAH